MVVVRELERHSDLEGPKKSKMFYYCESEQGSTCSTPFVSAPSSPSRNSTTNMKNNSLYYYFSAPSSPPRHEETIQNQNQAQNHHQQHQRGFSFTECEFQFHSAANAASGHLLQSGNASPKRGVQAEEEEMEDADVTGFYFSAPTSPDRNKDRFNKAGIKSCSYWDEMPGTPKMIFGGAKNAAGSPSGFFNADSDFEFSSSRMSDSDSAVSVQMSSADELFFKGQLLPLKLKTHQLTSSDSSGSSNTMGAASGSSIAGSAPQSPKSGKKVSSGAARDASPNRMKSAVMGTICGAVLKTSGSISDSAASDSTPGTRIRSLSPLQLLKKYQSMMMMMGRPSSKPSSSSASSSAASFSASSSLSSTSSSSSQPIPRPTRTSSKGRTLRELLHLSSVHKKNKAAPAAAASSSQQQQQSEAANAAAAAAAPASVSASSSVSSTSSSTDSNRIIKELIKPDESTRPTSETPSSDNPSKSQQIPVPKSAETASVSKRFTDTSSSSSSSYRKRFVERSLVGDYTKKFNTKQQHQQAKPSSCPGGIRRRFHSGSILDLHYGNPKRFHSSSIVPEADYYSQYSGPLVMNGAAQYPHGYRTAYRAALGLDNKRLNYHVAENRKGTLSQFHSGPIEAVAGANSGPNSGSKRFVNAAALANLADHPQGVRRWENGVHYNNLFNAAAAVSNNVGGGSSGSGAAAGSTAGTPSSACSSRNVSPRRSRHSSSASGSGISLHELHYKTQRANAEEMRRKTFLPYKQGLLGCLGCATMRIAGLSKTLQPMTSSAR